MKNKHEETVINTVVVDVKILVFVIIEVDK